MKFRYLFLLGLLVFAGCAVYKQLKPEPPLSPAEQGYIELKKKEKNFTLKKGKRYFISFPPPLRKKIIIWFWRHLIRENWPAF